MKVILTVIVIAGPAFLQSKALPSEADVKKAQDRLKNSPEDPAANLITGKHFAFVSGDALSGMAFLVKSSDKTLRTLAEHELDPLYADTAVKKVALADEWVAAAKTIPGLTRPFFDRASDWYAAAWADLDLVWKEKTRARGLKIAAARPPGSPRKTLPEGFNAGTSPGSRPPVLDGSIAHTGSYSIRMSGPDEKVK